MARTKIKKGALTFKICDDLLGLLLCYLLPHNELPNILTGKGQPPSPVLYVTIRYLKTLNTNKARPRVIHFC